ncbi:hypothetical protein [Mucilaginibacter sp.]|uniref:DUF1281 family ferredoxin-like fold protein n=1 Tax=Mucilaginibacter sp. TaxID=1882438 RepID=UPI00326340BA
MANWCSNIVSFKGDKQSSLQITKLFNQLMAQEKAQERGQLPEFITDEDGYMFEIWRIANVVTYETRWSPNTAIVKAIADHFQVDFIYEYVEPMNSIHGKLSYSNGELKTLK